VNASKRPHWLRSDDTKLTFRRRRAAMANCLARHAADRVSDPGRRSTTVQSQVWSVVPSRLHQEHCRVPVIQTVMLPPIRLGGTYPYHAATVDRVKPHMPLRLTARTSRLSARRSPGDAYTRERLSYGPMPSVLGRLYGSPSSGAQFWSVNSRSFFHGLKEFGCWRPTLSRPGAPHDEAICARGRCG
jgi:hypothetical protein